MGSTGTPTVSDVTITGYTITDLRFPTSLDGIGSDAMHKGTNGSHPYIRLHTTHPDLTGEGISNPPNWTQAFSNGRGSEIITLCLDIYAKRVVNKSMHQLTRNMGKTWRYMVSDSQYRWVGPEKSVTHLAVAGVLNAVWDLWGKILQKPVWRIVADMTAEEFVRCVDFRYITDVVTPEEGVEMLRSVGEGKKARIAEALRNESVPAYTTSAGWLAFSGDKMRRVLQQTIDEGYTTFKFKVGSDLHADRERLAAVRELLGYDNGYQIMIDANQVWSVPEAIEWMKQLAEFKPVFIEEPTSPDDILGHAAIRKALRPYGIGVATGEMAQNRVIFKQLLQAEATDVAQIDAVRLGSAVMLMARKHNIPCVPHNGAFGLTELTSHLSNIDYICVSGRKSMLEHAVSYSENLRHPSKVENAHYVTPLAPGYSVGYTEQALKKYTYPSGQFWTSEAGQKIIGASDEGEL